MNTCSHVSSSSGRTVDWVQVRRLRCVIVVLLPAILASCSAATQKSTPASAPVPADAVLEAARASLASAKTAKEANDVETARAEAAAGIDRLLAEDAAAG